MGESEFNCWGDRGARSCYSCFKWMYLECAYGLACPLNLWPYGIPGFSSALDSLSPWLNGSTLGYASCFLSGNRVAKLKPITFSSFLLFLLFLSFLFSWPSRAIVPLSAACWDYSLIIIIIIIIYSLVFNWYYYFILITFRKKYQKKEFRDI